MPALAGRMKLKFARAILKIRRGHLLGRGCVVSWGGGWVGLLCPPSPRIQKNFLREKNQPPHDENHFPYLVPYNPLLIRVRHFPVFQNDFKTRVTKWNFRTPGNLSHYFTNESNDCGGHWTDKVFIFLYGSYIVKIVFFFERKISCLLRPGAVRGGAECGTSRGQPSARERVVTSQNAFDAGHGWFIREFRLQAHDATTKVRVRASALALDMTLRGMMPLDLVTTCTFPLAGDSCRAPPCARAPPFRRCETSAKIYIGQN